MGWTCRWGWSDWWQGEYSLLTLPASALMLFRPTVAPARPCRVPREVREFMAPALELAVVPAAGGREEVGGGRRRGKDGGRQKCRYLTKLNKIPEAQLKVFLLNRYQNVILEFWNVYGMTLTYCNYCGKNYLYINCGGAASACKCIQSRHFWTLFTTYVCFFKLCTATQCITHWWFDNIWIVTTIAVDFDADLNPDANWAEAPG